jgi:HD-GYP domain-containing protein (c-di-GMP phosphodiesterase class II)
MINRLGKARTTIRMTVVTVFILATAITAAVAIGLHYYFGQSLAKRAAENLYTLAAAGVATELQGLKRVNSNILELLADNADHTAPGRESELLARFTGILERNPLFYGVYLGRGDGSFYEVINLAANEAAREALGASPADRWVVVSDRDSGSGQRRSYSFLDANLGRTGSRTETSEFDVKSRQWYVDAMEGEGIQRTGVYRFAQSNLPGRTLSRRVTGTDSVVAIDMTLTRISDFLRAHPVARHAAIYLYDREGGIIGSSLGSGVPADSLPTALLTEIAADRTRHGRLQETQVDGKTLLVYAAPPVSPDAPETTQGLFMGITAPLDSVAGPYLEKVKLSILVTAALLLLLLPASWLFATPIVRPIRQLALENDKVRQRHYDQVERVDSHVKELDELSESMVNMVEAIRAHELAQRRLMDSFIQLIARAIDDKSPYTAGHCARVPELAMMLAERAAASDLPPFRDFRMETEDQWREYRIAAWLHDCGKITTPEHVVDKGSKLETIYNRVHEIRTRFEVLWRDAEIDYWRGTLENPGDEPRLRAELEARRTALQEDWAFVADCNVGGEFLDEARRERLKRIAGITWERHFDNTLGLSPVEELRLADRVAQSLPVREQLLSDRPEHIIPRNGPADYPPEFGIRMEVPQQLYNQGELYNLSISRGTLTREDRFKINEHMISTIKMLESLPFPPELANVPRWASTHHETMAGTGYPRKLPGEALSIPERIMAVADVFEALTAADRPYKRAKPISVAVDILHRMVLDNHIDRDCFELFIRNGVYLQYARRFLPPEQIDEVDIGRYLRAGEECR